MFNIRNRSTTKEMCKKYTILRLPDIHLLNIGTFMYKFYNDSLPPIFNEFFTENRNIHNYPTRNAAKLRIPRVRTNLAERFIRKSGVKFWNDTRENLDTNCSLSTFKKLLKKLLTRNYEWEHTKSYCYNTPRNTISRGNLRRTWSSSMILVNLSRNILSRLHQLSPASYLLSKLNQKYRLTDDTPRLSSTANVKGSWASRVALLSQSGADLLYCRTACWCLLI